MLRALWRVWLVVARKIGQVQSFVILGLVYFVFIAPFGAAVRLCSDPLGLGEARSWQWVPPGDEARSSLSAMRLQSWGGRA